MNVLILGGTGLLGSQGAKELIARGHHVKTLARREPSKDADIPAEMEIIRGNFMNMSDDEMREQFRGCEGFVFAAGIDERVEGPAPVYDMFKKYNIDPTDRLLRLAKECGVKHAVICGSCFSYSDRTCPEMKLYETHPYIRSRRDQETVAMSYADENFDVAVLELSYIFGAQPGRRPVWVFMVESIRSMKGATMWPKGGTAMVTTRQVGQAIAGALERNRGGNCYPIGWFNLTWKEMLKIFHKHLGCPDKKIITIPDWMYAMAGMKIKRDQKKRGIEGGLDMVKYTKLQCSNQFMDKSLGCVPLGVTDDDIDAAIGESVRLCVAILDGTAGEVKNMKGD